VSIGPSTCHIDSMPPRTTFSNWGQLQIRSCHLLRCFLLLQNISRRSLVGEEEIDLSRGGRRSTVDRCQVHLPGFTWQ